MIRVEGLTKLYGDFVAIEDITFSVNEGEIVGFLGPNGAGKTTTMRILTGFMPATEGTAQIAGYDIFSQSLEARRHIGYLPETVPLYTDMTVRGYLDFQGTLRGLKNPRRTNRIDDIIERMRLDEYADTLIGKLSKGYRQRVGLSQALLHEPDVLILDEPTIGIDPIQVVETRQLIKELGKNHTILLSSHILPEVSMVCERVVVVNEGRLVAVDRPENLSTRLGGADRLRLAVRGPAGDVAAALRQVAGVLEVEVERAPGGVERAPGGVEQAHRFVLVCRPGRDLREEVAALIVRRNWGLLELQPMGMSLEEIFLRLTTHEEL
ncbi:MAG: ATP-binding cassette domain-containing protein [Chloroflexi bacterium]|nr:ATP-binding cassette domain-containing protein [Chloroflexota bacterium]